MDSAYSGAVPAAACFLAIAFLYSQYNTRSTEHMTHPLWNLILFRLCEKHITQGRLIPTPQYRIWVTKTEASEYENNDVTVGEQGAAGEAVNFLDGLEGNDDSEEEEEVDKYDRSCATISQSPKNIMEVIADYVVLVPQVRLQVKTGITWLDDNPSLANIKTRMLGCLNDPAHFLEQISFIFPTWTTVRACKVYMPLLLELKRPVSRNPSTIDDHTSQINARLSDAMSQVEEQALCLFKSGKFSHQRWAFLVAATGDFWTFRVIVRGKAEGGAKPEFSKKKYATNWGAKYSYDLDEVEDEDQFMERLIENRVAAEKISSDAGKKQIYPAEEMNRLMAAKGNFVGTAGKRKTFNDSNEWIAEKPIELSKDIVGCFHWSPIFKIGTEASHAALSYISSELDEFVSQNGVVIT